MEGKIEKPVVYVFFLSFLVLTVKELQTPYFPLLLLSTLLIFLNYSLRFRVRELLPGIIFVVVLLGVSSLLSKPPGNQNVREVLWIKELPNDEKVAFVEGHKYIKLRESAFPGDKVDLSGNLVERSNFSPERVRYELYKGLEEKIDYPVSSLVGAVTLGVRYELPDSIKGYFSLAGIYHFLAISGLHVGIVVGFLSLLFKTLRIRRPVTLSSILILPLIPLTGLTPSVLRAYLFTFLLGLGLESYRKVNPLYLLGVVLLMSVTFTEFNLSAALSFSAAGGILLALRGRENWWLKTLKVSVSPVLFTLPVVLTVFGTLNLLSWINSIVSTILFIPFLIFSFMEQITLGKFELINRFTENLGFLFVESSKFLFNLTKWAVIHCEVPLFISGAVMVLSLFLVLFSKPSYSFVPPILLLIYSLIFPTNVTKNVFIDGKKLNSFYFISTEGQRYSNSKIESSYVLPYTRELLFKSKLVDLRLRKNCSKIPKTKRKRGR